MVNLVRLLTLTVLLLLPGLVAAEAWRFVNENLVVSDSDDAEQRAHYFGVRAEMPWFMGNAGLMLGQWSLKEPIGNEDFNGLRLLYSSSDDGMWQFSGKLEYLNGNGWSPWLASVNAVYRPSEKWRFEGSIEKGIVDSVAGVRQKLDTETYSISADWAFLPQWTLVGALLSMDIDDGNRRNGGVLRLIYDIPGVDGLNLQTRSKRLESDFDGNGYFSPPVLEEHLLMVGYARPAFDENWVFSVLTGAGKQIIEPVAGPDIKNDLYYLELKARGWFTPNYGTEARGYCTNTGGPNFGTPDDAYRYCNLVFSLFMSY